MAGTTVIQGTQQLPTTNLIGVFGRTAGGEEDEAANSRRYAGLVRDIDDKFYFFDNKETDPDLGVGKGVTGYPIGDEFLIPDPDGNYDINKAQISDFNVKDRYSLKKYEELAEVVLRKLTASGIIQCSGLDIVDSENPGSKVWNYDEGHIHCMSVSTSSDQRLKTDIEDIHNPIEIVKALNGKTFNWKNRSNERGKNYGFIAQEIEYLLPSVVKKDNDSFGKLSVNYDSIVPILTEAVKVLIKEIDDLKVQLHECKK
jgi:hypothetical protein